MRACRVLLLVAVGAASADAAADVRAEFRSALSRVVPAEAHPDSAALREYLLYPYIEAARLRHRLSRVPDGARDAELEQAIREFLGRHDDEPVTRELRREWLDFLGARAAWAEFLQDADPEPTEPALQCYALRARQATGKPEAVREAAVVLWTTVAVPPKPCEPLFEWLDRPEHVSDGEIEQRALLAARRNLKPPRSQAVLPASRRALMELWQRLLAQPERELRRLADRRDVPQGLGDEKAGVAEAIVEAFGRTARRDSRQARLVYEALRLHKAVDDAHKARLQREHALGLAYDFDRQALEHFRDLPPDVLDALAHEWRVRTALLHREWAQAEQWLDAMPEPQRNEPRWRYWRARLLERAGRDEAQALYAAVAREREYYGFLAAERLGQVPHLRPVPLADDPSQQQRLLAQPALQRARELLLCELNDLAAAELRFAIRDEPPAVRAQAARLAALWGWHEMSVRILSELQLWDDLWLRFPLPHEPAVTAAARDSGVPAEWLHAVLRTESLYNARALSGAGALGLLQLRLPTAREVARRNGLPRPSRDDLFDPGKNIELGARYLRELQARFAERWILTLAAYNAGPHRVPDWLPADPVDGDIWVENIPYNETRSYVQRALSSLVIITWRRSGEPGRILQYLEPVQSLQRRPAPPAMAGGPGIIAGTVESVAVPAGAQHR